MGGEQVTKGAFVWEYSGIRIYSGMYSGYSAPGSSIAGMEIQVFRNRKSSQTNANLHYSNYSYSGLIPNERALNTSLEWHRSDFFIFLVRGKEKEVRHFPGGATPIIWAWLKKASNFFYPKLDTILCLIGPLAIAICKKLI